MPVALTLAVMTILLSSMLLLGSVAFIVYAIVFREPISTGIGVGLLALAPPIFLAPTITAVLRQHHQSGAIAVTNLLLGWTALGWAVAMVWATMAVQP